MTKKKIVRLVPEYGPYYQTGRVSIENVDQVMEIDFSDCAFGVQVAADGRVWVCVNGVSWIRFKPS